MKRIFTLLIAAFAFVACGTFDDSEIWDRLDEYGETIKDHESRIAALEELCKQMNTNLESLQTIVEALENRDYITNVAPVTKDGAVVGYVISFAASETITIYHGEDGKDGSNGADGADGKDGSAPQIGVKQDSDGVYYWTINGEWLLDAQGNKVRATGEDGEKGEDGAVPKLKIENDKWFISYDEGATWLELGDATGEDGDNIFANVTYDDEFVYFEMTNGATITIPFSDKSDSNDTIENHKIYYTTSDNQKLFPNNTEPKIFNAILVSNTYENGVGVLLFDDTVTAIGELAFSDCDSLTSVTIPDSVTTIGEGAFKDCSSLTSVTIGDSVTTIGYAAFRYCDSLTSITIPDSVTTIGELAFSDCDSLTSITIPDSVTT
ncbi:MAG: leucine-rich repeat protein, partial [Alistipes sp.]|nr:leucine-rich repeat protein [Alistipes sp.]